MPLDPRHPPGRVAQSLSSAKVELVITLPTLVNVLAEVGFDALTIDNLEIGDKEHFPMECRERDTALVVFTSGSTGTPKGVMIEHGSLARFAVWNSEAWQIKPNDRIAAISSPGFDGSAWDTWPALASGASIVIGDDSVVLDPLRLRDWLIAERIAVIFLTTAIAEKLLQLDWPDSGALRTLLTGGERLTQRPALGTPFDVVNNYGPTEATVIVTSGPVEPLGQGLPTIGAPISIAEFHILDEDMAPVSHGDIGEIYLGGPGVARGYIARPDLTADRFVPDPFSGRRGARLYRSGDLGRRRPNGEIEFHGRIDDQVKIRGNRVEPGEVAAAIVRYPGVESVHVGVHTESSGELRLVAYYAGVEVNEVELKHHLDARLPRACVPSYFVQISELPLNANGKVDRTALPDPDTRYRAAFVPLVPPRNDLESRLCKLWARVLRVDQVGVEDSFFDLGGHSLLLIEVHRVVTRDMGYELPLVTLFEHPTIRDLSAILTSPASVRLGTATNALPAPHATGLRSKFRDLAVIGMAGRFPGADSVDEFWRNLCSGRDSIQILDKSAGRVYAHGVLEQSDSFDAGFFGYPPVEALIIDPQQRVFLECAYHALEDAGYDPKRFDGTIGLFAGGATTGYRQALEAHRHRLPFVDDWQLRLATGPDFLATRVADRLGLRGPVLSVQTACSTSLVAIHLAAQSILSGECDMALAGGATVHESLPRNGHTPSGLLSSDGRLRAFDADAKGVVGGSAAALVMLRPLAEALAAGDHIHAVLRGTAVGNDGGGKVGFAAPSVDGQARVIRAAYQRAGVDPRTVAYVEAHGTGTVLGDPIEVRALTKAWPADSPTEGCVLGSVKTNIGHTDAAAGVCAFIKATLAVESGTLPPTLNFRRPNPNIEMASTPFRVSTEVAALDDRGTPRRAGVNALGIGGTNAHAVIEEPPLAPQVSPGRPQQLVVLSARDEKALHAQGNALAERLLSDSQLRIADVAWTLQVGRPEHECRRFVVAVDVKQAAAKLRRSARRTQPQAGELRQVVFMFPGQGSQHAGMARGIYEAEPEFRQWFDKCCDLASPQLGFDLRDLLLEKTGSRQEIQARLDHISIGQPAVFAVEYSLAKLWMSWGITPYAVVGHSLGAYAAACISGVLSLPDAVEAVVERGRLLATLPRGAMLSVELSEEAIATLLAEGVSIAVINGPDRTTVSGDADAIIEFREKLAACGTRSQILRIPVAGHSHLAEPIKGTFENRMRSVQLKDPSIRFLSDLTGDWATSVELKDPKYWANHLCEPIRFSTGLEKLFAAGGTALLEVGPGTTLTNLVQQHPRMRPGMLAVHSLPHPTDEAADMAVLLTSLGSLWQAGVCVDWARVHAGDRRQRVKLPLYPYRRRRFSLQDGTSGESVNTSPEAEVRIFPKTNSDADGFEIAFKTMLGLDNVDRNDDFFELGGDSVIATRLISWIRETMNLDLSVRDLYSSRTPAALAALADGLSGRSSK